MESQSQLVRILHNTMARFIVVIAFLAFCNIVYALPTWENEDEADFSSSLEITRRRCSCSDDHHKCGCCLQVRAPAFQNYDEADVCMNSSFVRSPLAVDFFMMWNKRKVFNRTVSDSRPRPACFDIPRLNYGKACVKFTKITIKRDHTGGCAALELKSRHSGRDIPLGCFFFHDRDGHGVDVETFLDPASFMSLLKNVFQASKENQIDSISLLANPPRETLDGDVTEVMAVDKASCQCSKAPAQCDCCAEFKIFGHSVKACAHADIDSTGQVRHTEILFTSAPSFSVSYFSLHFLLLFLNFFLKKFTCSVYIILFLLSIHFTPNFLLFIYFLYPQSHFFPFLPSQPFHSYSFPSLLVESRLFGVELPFRECPNDYKSVS
ncbi:unnamed protein product [Pocillopora meandrina]|uniref:DUF4773 domain-containing protein n=1 Tax=Pocillopora meandrina TaxID=46732 RepID=A0AAU9XN90_9CNID|nr:unnamed protein product [Pocillopora meandrina]